MNRVRPRKWRLPLPFAGAGLLLAALLLTACGDNPTQPSSTDSSPSTPATCGTSCQDTGTVQALYNTVWFLWNANIAGTPTGTKALTANCPLGGSALITGTTAADTSTGINTAHLVYAFSACANSATYFNLAFTGSLAQDGTFKSLPYFEAMTYGGSGMKIAGTARDARVGVAQVSVSGTCDVNVAVQHFETSSTGSYAGSVCGRAVNFSW